MDGILETFDEGLWVIMVEYVTIIYKKKVVLTFNGGFKF
jgi:hypothetical protein